MHLLINFLIFVVGQMSSAIKISIVFLYKSHLQRFLYIF